jgi:type IV pilus assembly protein PilC
MEISIFDRVTNNDKMLLVNNLAVALKAGLTTDEALDINIEQTQSKKFKRILLSVKENIQDGKSISESFGLYPDVFTNVFLSIISAGEQSGKLEENLIHLGEQLEKEYDLQKKVQGALLYPVIILVATVFIAVGLSTFVLPKLLTLFNSFGEDLPLITKIILGLADGLRLYWPIIMGVGLISYFGYGYVVKVKAVKNFIDKMFLKVPVAGMMWRNMYLSRIARSFGSLLSSGLSINECMRIIKASQSNIVYHDLITSMESSINRGGTIYNAMSKSKYIPILAAKMVDMGERTGNLENTFNYLADYYEKELYRLADNLATTIEPFMLILVGAGVGVVAIAIITPIYQLTGSLNRFR